MIIKRCENYSLALATVDLFAVIKKLEEYLLWLVKQLNRTNPTLMSTSLKNAETTRNHSGLKLVQHSNTRTVKVLTLRSKLCRRQVGLCFVSIRNRKPPNYPRMSFTLILLKDRHSFGGLFAVIWLVPALCLEPGYRKWRPHKRGLHHSASILLAFVFHIRIYRAIFF